MLVSVITFLGLCVFAIVKSDSINCQYWVIGVGDISLAQPLGVCTTGYDWDDEEYNSAIIECVDNNTVTYSYYSGSESCSGDASTLDISTGDSVGDATIDDIVCDDDYTDDCTVYLKQSYYEDDDTCSGSSPDYYDITVFTEDYCQVNGNQSFIVDCQGNVTGWNNSDCSGDSWRTLTQDSVNDDECESEDEGYGAYYTISEYYCSTGYKNGVIFGLNSIIVISIFMLTLWYS